MKLSSSFIIYLLDLKRDFDFIINSMASTLPSLEGLYTL